jgi:hypothetical protein
MVYQELLQSIINNLTNWGNQVQVYSSNGLHNTNIFSEDIVAAILNPLFDWQLTNANLDVINYPGIDLHDVGENIYVQVSSTVNAKKVKETISILESQGKDISRLYFFELSLVKHKRISVPSKYQIDNIYTLASIIPKICELYNNDQDRFFQLYGILNREFSINPYTMKNDIVINISITNTQYSELPQRHRYGQDVDFHVYYTITEQNEIIHIEPHIKYLQGKHRMGAGCYEFGIELGVQFVDFYIKVTNKTNSIVTIKRAIFKIEESKIDPTPYVFVYEHRTLGYNEISFANLGWGEVWNCTLKFHIVPLNWDIKKKSPVDPFIRQIEDFDKYAYLNLNDIITSLGFGEDTFDADKADESMNEYLQKLGFLENDNYSTLNIIGELEFWGYDVDYKKMKYKLPFLSEVSTIVPTLGGGHSWPSYRYNGPILKETGTDYQLEKELSQFIEGNNVDRFTILLPCFKSALHHLVIDFVLDDDQVISSKPIQMNTVYLRDYHNFDYLESVGVEVSEHDFI